MLFSWVHTRLPHHRGDGICPLAGGSNLTLCLPCFEWEAGAAMACKVQAAAVPQTAGIHSYYQAKIEELESVYREKAQNLRRLEAQRNELNGKVRLLREELQLLQEPGSYVGEVVKAMGKNKVLVKVNPEGKYVVDLDKNIDATDIKPNLRVALRNDSYVLHKVPLQILLHFFKC